MRTPASAPYPAALCRTCCGARLAFSALCHFVRCCVHVQVRQPHRRTFSSRAIIFFFACPRTSLPSRALLTAVPAIKGAALLLCIPICFPLLEPVFFLFLISSGHGFIDSFFSLISFVVYYINLFFFKTRLLLPAASLACADVAALGYVPAFVCSFGSLVAK